MRKESKYNAPRVGEKRWSAKYKKKINCSNPKGFSQKQYCKRKSRGGKYKNSFEIIESLVKIANHLDSISLINEADAIDSILYKLASEQYNKDSFSERLQAIVNKDQGLRKSWEKLVMDNGGWNISEDKMNALVNRFAEENKTTKDSLFGDEEGQEEFLGMLEEGINWGDLSKQDWKNIFLISQHFDSRRDIQKRMREVFGKYLGIESDEFRYISDRISCAYSGKQEFGTQYICEKSA